MICIWVQHERDTAAWRYGSLISDWLWLGYSTTSGWDGESTAVLFYAALDGRAAYGLFYSFKGFRIWV